MRGVVKDADFRESLPGVQVGVLENGASTQTDADGRFAIQGLPPGKYTLSVVREGYARKLVYDVLVTARTMRELDIAITANVVELEDFVVGSDDLLSGSPTNLLEVRQNLTTFVDSIGAELIRLTGASDAGAALRRVVGTSVVDKKYVVIRGLADRYNTVTLNGLRVPSSDPDKRAVNVDLFPGGLISAINNSKTFSPELPSESTGGNVDILLKSRVDKPFVNASLKIGYNTNATGNPNFVTYRGPDTGIFGTLAERRIPDFLKTTNTNTFGKAPPSQNIASAIVLRERAARTLSPITGVDTDTPPEDISLLLEAGTKLDFFGKPLGVLAGFTYSKEYRFDPATISGRIPLSEPLDKPSLFDQQVGTESLLSALFFNLGYEIDPDNRVRATFLANVAAEDLAAFGVRHPIGVPDRVFTPYKNRGGLNDLATVQESLQYTERRLRTLQVSGDHHFTNGASFEWGAAYSLSSQDQPDARFNGGGQVEGENIERVWRSLNDDSYNIRLDFKQPLFGTEGSNGGVGFKNNRNKVELRAGLNFDHSARTYRADNFAYNFSGLVRRGAEISPSDRVGLTDADLVGRSSLTDPGTFLFRNGAFEVYNARQDIFAGYGGVSVNFSETLNATVGARVEVAEISVARSQTFAEIVAGGDSPSATFYLLDLNTGLPIPDAEVGRGKISSTDVLPTFSATWDFAKDMKLKLAVSRTVARPSFKELGPVFTREPVSLAFFVGNPNLKPSQITNYDLRYEWYSHPGDIVALSFFSKYIQNPIEFFDAGNLRFFKNEKTAQVYGAEFEISQNLGLLAEPLRPFTLTGNFSRIFSNVQLSNDSEGQRRAARLPLTRRLQAQPDYILNVGAIYDNKEFGLNAGVFLNVVGQLLWAAGGQVNDTFRDAYQQPLTSLDAVISKKLTGNVRLTLRAMNLTDATVLRQYDNGRLFSSRRDGPTFSLSLGGEW